MKCVEPMRLNPVFKRAGRWKVRSSMQLTPRQRQIAGLLARGMNNKEIATELGISAGSLKVYLSDAYFRLGFSARGDSRIRLVLYFLSQLYE
jgi:DNA-binding NarL/FixJ family response regulator